MPFSDSKPDSDTIASGTPSVSYAAFCGAAAVRKEAAKVETDECRFPDADDAAQSAEREVNPGK